MAYKMSLPVKEVGETMIVPITKSDPRSVEQMQSMAEQRGFLSVASKGWYTKASGSGEPDCTAGRKLNLKGE